jgi:hypothetical protein
MDAYFYKHIVEIDKLFNKNVYLTQISSKSTNESYAQTIIYKNKDNSETTFTINIFSQHYIKVTLPINNSNYLYTTNFQYIEDVYNYLKVHTTV